MMMLSAGQIDKLYTNKHRQERKRKHTQTLALLSLFVLIEKVTIPESF
jgi:hypothetical protein